MVPYLWAMKQQCYLAVIYLNWLLLATGLVYLSFTHRYALAGAWLIALPLALYAYIRYFPLASQAMGYGTVDDKPADHLGSAVLQNEGPPLKVTLYTALGCPFCPIVERRLREMQARMKFEIYKVDVTLRPDLLTSRGIRAVPVVEVDSRRIEGNATTEQLSKLITGQLVTMDVK